MFFHFFSSLFILILLLSFHQALGYCQEFMHSVSFTPKQLDGMCQEGKSVLDDSILMTIIEEKRGYSENVTLHRISS